MSNVGQINHGAFLKVVGALLASSLVAAQGVQAWAAWKRDLAPVASHGVAEDALVSVTLINGQVFYGRVAVAGGRAVILENVYYVQTVVDSGTSQRGNRLVSRQKTDWHAPTTMTIPVEKVMMIEKVGVTSRLNQLIEQDEGKAPPAIN